MVIDIVNKTETHPESVHELLDRAIRHQLGVIDLTDAAHIRSVIEHHQARKLRVDLKRIVDNPEAEICENQLKHAPYAKKWRHTIGFRNRYICNLPIEHTPYRARLTETMVAYSVQHLPVSLLACAGAVGLLTQRHREHGKIIDSRPGSLINPVKFIKHKIDGRSRRSFRRHEYRKILELRELSGRPFSVSGGIVETNIEGNPLIAAGFRDVEHASPYEASRRNHSLLLGKIRIESRIDTVNSME